MNEQFTDPIVDRAVPLIEPLDVIRAGRDPAVVVSFAADDDYLLSPTFVFTCPCGALVRLEWSQSDYRCACGRGYCTWTVILVDNTPGGAP